MQGTDYMASAAELGLDEGKLAGLRARARREVDEGLLPAVQIAVARRGRLALFDTYGGAQEDSLFCVFSATKAITSAAAWLLIQDGLLDTGVTVASLVPEFGTNGKEAVTVEQLFTHTAGFPNAPFRVTDWPDKASRYSRFQKWRLNYEPGTKYEYHPTSSMWVIAEIIERLSGMEFAAFVRQKIIEPLGLPDLWLGTPDEVRPRVTKLSIVGEPMTPAEYEAAGLPVPPVTEVTPEVILGFNLPEVQRVPVPGGGGIMSAAELALFYQGLLGELPKGGRLWSAQTMARVNKPLTGGLIDMSTGAPCHRGLGLVIAGDEKRNLRGFGHTNSPEAFGHSGAGGQIAWADPQTGISFAYCTNGHDQNALRQGRRGVSVSSLAAVCAA